MVMNRNLLKKMILLLLDRKAFLDERNYLQKYV